MTSHGKPVARLVPAEAASRVPEEARAALLAHLDRQPTVEVGRWTREELYEDGT